MEPLPTTSTGRLGTGLTTARIFRMKLTIPNRSQPHPRLLFRMEIAVALIPLFILMVERKLLNSSRMAPLFPILLEWDILQVDQESGGLVMDLEEVKFNVEVKKYKLEVKKYKLEVKKYKLEAKFK